jgi:hemoglobin/transferrin/lactoferrin receptor protein
MSFSVPRIAVLIVALGIGAGANAQAPVTTTEEKPPANEATTPPPVAEKITVTATRFERPIDLTPQSVTVMDAQEIHARPMWNVAAALDDAPGISFQRAGALDGQLVIRGLSSNDSRIVLFIDGDRFRGRNFLEYSLLDPNEIERIEIVRGPAAALYGSDAMNGVVNVITRRAQGDPTKPFSLRPSLYALGYSSANQMGAGRLELQGVGNGLDMLLGMSYRTGDDYESPLGRVPNSDFRTRSFTARIGYLLGATRRLELIAKTVSNDNGRAGAPGAPLVTTRQDPLKTRYLRLGFTEGSVVPWIQDVEASLYHRRLSSILRSESRTAANGNVDTRNSWVTGPFETGGKLLARSVIGTSVLAYGADFYHEDAPGFQDDDRIVNPAGATTFLDPRTKRARDASQTDVGLLTHWDWDPSARWTASLGGRYDVVETRIDSKPAPGESPQLSAAFDRNRSARDNSVTGSAGVIFRPLPVLHLVGNISTAFRSPTTGDKSGTGTVGALNTIPNADLKPETSVSYEAGTRLRFPSWNVNLTAFRTDYKDLIGFRFLDPNTRERINIGRSKVDGVELDGTYEMTKDWVGRFNAATARGTNTLTGVPLSYVPPLNGLVALRHSLPHSGAWVELTDRWSRDKTRIDPTQERKTDGYNVLSLYTGLDLGRFQPRLKSYRLTVGIENLTDETYRNPVTKELIGFPVTFTNPLIEPGRSLTVNLTAGF